MVSKIRKLLRRLKNDKWSLQKTRRKRLVRKLMQWKRCHGNVMEWYEWTPIISFAYAFRSFCKNVDSNGFPLICSGHGYKVNRISCTDGTGWTNLCEEHRECNSVVGSTNRSFTHHFVPMPPSWWVNAVFQYGIGKKLKDKEDIHLAAISPVNAMSFGLVN